MFYLFNDVDKNYFLTLKFIAGLILTAADIGTMLRLQFVQSLPQQHELPSRFLLYFLPFLLLQTIFVLALFLHFSFWNALLFVLRVMLATLWMENKVHTLCIRIIMH